MKEEFFKFDKSRWTIFIIIFLLFPVPITYPSTPCKIFQEPGILQALCTVGPYPMIFSLIVTIFDKYGGVNLIISLIDLIFSFILSYPINLIYKKIRKKYFKWHHLTKPPKNI